MSALYPYTMMKKAALGFALSFLVLSGVHAGDSAGLNDVFSILRTNLDGVSQRELEDAAIAGLAKALGPRVLFENNSAISASNSTPLPAKAFGEFGYVRLTRVNSGLDARLSKAISALDATNKLKGLVLDLRFAQGADYPAAAAVASLFISQERPLLSWNGGSAKSVSNPDAVSLPLVVLMNRETTGAAEALAAVLRDALPVLLLGNRTAGLGVTYKDFPLGDGRSLKIAGTPVEIPGKGVLPASGLTPDITVDVSLSEERAYFLDPYLVSSQPAPSRSVAASSFLDDEDIAASGHRLNEAELVRRQKLGVVPEEAISEEPATRRRMNEAELIRERRGGIAGQESARTRPLTDPALLRALDLLKALAVVRTKPA